MGGRRGVGSDAQGVLRPRHAISGCHSCGTPAPVRLLNPVKQIELDLEREGLTAGTFPFEAEKRKRQVELCKRYKAVPSCWKCPSFDHCSLIKHHLRDMRYHRKGLDNETDAS